MDIWKFIATYSSEIGAAGTVIGTCSLVLAIVIFIVQGRQSSELHSLNKNINDNVTGLQALSQRIDDHILGTVTGFESVLAKLEALLNSANGTDHANVYVMAYWLWFGVDEDFPSIPLANIGPDTSRICCLLRARISGNKQTTLVLYRDRASIRVFVEALFNYKASQGGISVTAAQVDQLVDRYMQEVTWLEAESKTRTKFKLAFRDEIPAIMFAVQGDETTGLYYIGETAMLREKAALGGFTSRSPAMVGMLVNQIRHFASVSL